MSSDISEDYPREKGVNSVLGIDLEGKKDLLGLWISETENAKYWLKVLTDMRNRGVKDILIVTSVYQMTYQELRMP